MAVEDAEQINASMDTVEAQKVFQRVSPKPAVNESSGSVSSPASSVKTDNVEQKVVSEGKESKKVVDRKSIDKSQLEEITEAINQELSLLSTTIQFKIEESSSAEAVKREASSKEDVPQVEIKKKEVVISVIDKRTGEVIRKIPPEDLLQSLYNATMFLGMLVDQII